MNYAEISKDTVSYLYKSYASLKNSSLEPTVRILLELRTSQINGCAYCCGLHLEEARKFNIPQEKLDLLAAWHTSTIFTDKEVAALQWCEEVTRLNKNKTRELLKAYYSEREIVDLTACVAIMNALNRMAINLRD